MIDPQIADWLVRFAAGAGTLYEWQVNEAGVLRAYAGDVPMCPLSAQYTLETGILATDEDADFIAKRALGWGPVRRERLTQAADNLNMYFSQRATIRAHLLRICRVEEPSHDSV